MERCLKGKLPQEELADVLVYHREYFEEAGPNAANEIDPPEVIAQRVLEEHLGTAAGSRPGSHTGGIVIAAVLLGLCAVVVIFNMIFGLSPIQWITRKIINRPYVPAPTTIIDNVVASSIWEGERGSSQGIIYQSSDDAYIYVTGEDLAAFNAVGVYGQTANRVEVKREGETYALFMRYPVDAPWHFFFGDGTLNISGDDSDKGAAKDTTIIITVPEDVDLSDVTVDLGVGEITLSGVRGESGYLHTGVGQITVSEAALSRLTCDADTGDVEVVRSKCDSVCVTSKVGDVTLSQVTGDIDVRTDVGNVDVRPAGPLSAYSLSLNAGLGEITVDGRKQAGDSYATDQGGLVLNASAGAGAVSVEAGEAFEPDGDYAVQGTAVP